VIVRIVRFRSGPEDSAVVSAFAGRARRYREVKGLRQKYYLRFPETGEYGAVYVWDSRRALEDFNRSELARSIPEVYRVEGAPQGEVAEILLTLRGD
jgi:heme-degrading monooxygenase HmoA